MEEITFVDVLTHYQMKLKEASDEVETIRNQLKKAQSHVDSGWGGDAADACRLQLESVDGELTKTLSELSEALVKLSAIGELLAEEPIILI